MVQRIARFKLIIGIPMIAQGTSIKENTLFKVKIIEHGAPTCIK